MDLRKSDEMRIAVVSEVEFRWHPRDSQRLTNHYGPTTIPRNQTTGSCTWMRTNFMVEQCNTWNSYYHSNDSAWRVQLSTNCWQLRMMHQRLPTRGRPGISWAPSRRPQQLSINGLAPEAYTSQRSGWATTSARLCTSWEESSPSLRSRDRYVVHYRNLKLY